MNVSELTDGREVWTDFQRRNGGGILQTYEWGEFRRDLGWRARHVMVDDGGTARLAGLVLQKPLPAGHCLFYTPEGPTVRDGDWHDPKNRQAFESFVSYLRGLSRSQRAVFLKVDPHVPAEAFPVDWLSGLGFVDSPEDIQAAVVTHVDLKPSEDDILAAMKPKGRYNIRYAEKKGVTVRSGGTSEDLEVFYRLLEGTAKRQGITYREKSYFKAFRRHFMERSDQARFFIAEREGAALAGILVTFFGRESIYLYGGTDPGDRNIYASYLVQWQAMREAKRRGAEFYNMTGVAATDDPAESWAGLRQFKLKFGGPVIHLLGARDLPLFGWRYRLFTQADRVRRFVSKRSGH